MNKNIIRVILIILLFWTFTIIFGFSNQNGEESGSISQKITNIVTQNINFIQRLENTQKQKVLFKIEYIIRKIAHFSLYTIVGILLMSLLCTYNLKNKTKIYVSTIIGLIYASTDEIHQIFVPDRSPAFTDVIIDTLGVIFGIILVNLIRKIYINTLKTH